MIGEVAVGAERVAGKAVEVAGQVATRVGEAAEKAAAATAQAVEKGAAAAEQSVERGVAQAAGLAEKSVGAGEHAAERAAGGMEHGAERAAAKAERLSPRAALGDGPEHAAGGRGMGGSGDSNDGREGRLKDDIVEAYKATNGLPSLDNRSLSDTRQQVYKTDAEGRPRVAEGWLTRGEREPRGSEAQKVQQGVSGPYNELGPKELGKGVSDTDSRIGNWEATWRDRDLTMHGSHLIGHAQMGADKSYNMVALPSEQNVREMKKIENHANRLLDNGQNVYMQSFVHGYMDNDKGKPKIPTEVTVRLFTEDKNGKLVQEGPDHSIMPVRVH